MSFYNLVFGLPNMYAVDILSTIGLTVAGIPRFRDAHATSSHEIAVYTRLGAGNREHQGNELTDAGPACSCYGCWITYVAPTLKYFLRAVDDEFDSTYCTLYFSYPYEYEEYLKSVEDGEWNPSQRWRDSLNQIQSNGLTPEQKQALGPIVKILERIANMPDDIDQGPFIIGI